MSNEFITLLLAGGGGPIITGVLGWWIKGMLADIKKIRELDKHIQQLTTKVEMFSGELKLLNNMIMQNNKEIAVTDQKVQAAFRQLDSLNREAKL